MGDANDPRARQRGQCYVATSRCCACARCNEPSVAITPPRRPRAAPRRRAGRHTAAAVGADSYSGTEATSPEEQILYEVWAGRLDNNIISNATVKVPVYIVVQYDCVFTNPKTLSSS